MRYARCRRGSRNSRDFKAGYPLDCRNDFTNRETTAIAEIVRAGRRPALKRLQGHYMRIREVRDMDVIAYTGAVRRIVVGPEDRYVRSTPRGRVEHQWY